MKIIVAGFILALAPCAARAVEAPTECQTEESRKYFYTAQGMNEAAANANPWRGCSGNCTMQSSTADAMTINQRNFEAEATAALAKSRAAEAAKCPQWADRIMAGIGVATPEKQTKVAADYAAAIKKEYDKFEALKTWQIEHKLCKHVEWWVTGVAVVNDRPSGVSTYSPEDFSGNYKGKPGQCSADGHGVAWRGNDDDLTMEDPAQNDLIGKTACDNVLFAAGLVDASWGYVDPKFCAP